MKEFFPTRNENQIKCKVQYLITKGYLISAKQRKKMMGTDEQMADQLKMFLENNGELKWKG